MEKVKITAVRIFVQKVGGYKCYSFVPPSGARGGRGHVGCRRTERGEKGRGGERGHRRPERSQPSTEGEEQRERPGDGGQR